MALEGLIQYIVNPGPGGAADAGRQAVYKSVADAAYGQSNANLSAQDANVSLKSDILNKQMDIKTQQSLQASGIPKNTDGSVDYRTLAGMIAPTNPKLAIDYSKEADNQDRIAATEQRDKAKSKIDGIKAMSDDLAAVQDQDGLNAFLSKAQALNYPLPPNFPTQYNAQTKGAIQAAGKVYAGALKNLDQQYKQAQIKTQQSERTRNYASATREIAAANIDKDKDARLRAGVPEKLPMGFEPDPATPGSIRPIKGGPADPASPNYRAPANSRPSVAEEKITQNYITMKNAEDVLDSPDFKDKNLAFLATVERDADGYFHALDKYGRNRALTEDEQVIAQAAAQFAEGAGHAKSGARINRGTMSLMTNLYIPMPGDKAAVKARKRAARLNDIEAAKVAGGRGVERYEKETTENGLPEGFVPDSE